MSTSMSTYPDAVSPMDSRGPAGQSEAPEVSVPTPSKEA